MSIKVIAEIGINHNSFLASALDLVDMAVDAGADFVKLQKRTPELCVPKSEWDNIRLTPWGEEMRYIDYRHAMEFGTHEYELFDAHCDYRGIEWTASVWDIPSVDFITKFDPPFIKIPSAKLTDLSLIKAARETGIPLMLSTGMSNSMEVDQVVRVLGEASSQGTLLHCHSAYPAPNGELNLSLIPWMKKEYGARGIAIGYSSHSVSPFPAIFAAASGAEVLEVHVTLDRALPGSDHAASLERKGLELITRAAKNIPVVRGDGIKRVWPSEQAARKKLRG